MSAGHILVVDDEEALCAVLKDTLEMEGYKVETCPDVTSARAKLAEYEFDTALIDVYLSEEPDGISLCNHILSNHPRTAPILVTGYAEESDIREGIAAGVYSCIRKPFALDDVIRVVNTAIGYKM